jgi:ribosome-binding protein aMBF1 (putative translation factor)
MTNLKKIEVPQEDDQTVYPAIGAPADTGANYMSNSSSDYTLGERICKARDIAGLSTAQLARRLGIKTLHCKAGKATAPSRGPTSSSCWQAF